MKLLSKIEIFNSCQQVKWNRSEDTSTMDKNKKQKVLIVDIFRLFVIHAHVWHKFHVKITLNSYLRFLRRKRMNYEELHGVETNEFSRFVDHSFASPFEILCYDFEKIFLSWKSNENNCKPLLTSLIKFDGNRYILTYYNNEQETSNFIEESNKLCSEVLYDCFGITKYIILTTDGHWVNVTTSSRKVLFSALLIALNAANFLNIPAFIVNLDISRVDLSTRRIIGYQIKQQDCFQSTIMYESHILENVNYASDIYYLDGITKLFENKIALACNIYDRYSSLNALCSVTEIYRCQPLKTHHVDISFPNLNKENKILLLLWNAFPEYITSNKLLKEILISVCFPNIKSDAFVDNYKYTTLQISQLLPNNWSAQVSYKRLYDVTLCHIKTDGERSYEYSTILSSGIRRLLALFIYFYSCKTDTSIASLIKLKIKKTKDYAHNIERATNTTEQISTHLTHLLHEICYIKSNNRISFHTRLQHIFTYINDFHQSNINKHMPISIFDQIAIFLSGYSVDIQCFSKLWDDFLIEFKAYFDRDQSSCPVIFPLQPTNETNEMSYNLSYALWYNQCSRNKSTIYLQDSCSSTQQLRPQQQEHKSEVSQLLNCICLYYHHQYEYLYENPITQVPSLESIIITDNNMTNITTTSDNSTNTSTNSTITTNSNSSSNSNIKIPKLQLRPLHTNNNLHSLYISLEKENSLSLLEDKNREKSRLLVVADIQSFKYENPHICDFEIFWQWYKTIVPNNNSASISNNNSDSSSNSTNTTQNNNDNNTNTTSSYLLSYEALEDIWNKTSAVCIEKQIPVYKWDDEVNTLFQILKSISPSFLCLELMISSIYSIFKMICNEVIKIENYDTQVNNQVVIYLHTEIDNLHIQIQEITLLSQEKVFRDSFLNKEQPHRSEEDFSPFVMSLMCKLDLISERIYILEEYIIKYYEITSILLPSLAASGNNGDVYAINKIHTICQQTQFCKNNNNIVLESNIEVTDVLNVVKQVSMSQNDNTWLGVDGRELGFPTQKIIDITCESYYDLLTHSYVSTNGSSNNNPARKMYNGNFTFLNFSRDSL